METPRIAAVTDPAVVSTPSGTMSPLQRAVAVFARPAQAWVGLEERAQFWFPLILMTLMIVGVTVLLFDRAIFPMIQSQWEQMVEAGRLPQEQYDRMVATFGGTAGLVQTIATQAVSWPIIMLLVALVVWFGVGFILGTKFRYRHALEVVTWSSLTLIPAQLIAAALGWSRGTMQGVHVGFGALVSEGDPPSKIQVALATFLDAIGPLSVWAVVVAVFGASYLSRAPRRSVAWVVGGLYLGINLVAAALAALFAPGA